MRSRCGKVFAVRIRRMTATEDPFMKIAEGRFPLSTESISSAGFWAPRFTAESTVPPVGEYVPRPDRNVDTLWKYSLLGFLGLDHFYLRSPVTGIAKLLTMGGFLVWWLWDLIQISTERERVLNYGLSGPFDAFTGVGQGMMYEGSKWNYSQITDFGSWAVATIFGFLGIDMFLLGRFWLGFRKLIIFLLTMSAIAPFLVKLATGGFWSAISSIGIFSLIWTIFCFMLAIGLAIIWMGDLSTILTHPDTIMKKGMPISQTAVDSLGWVKKLYMDDKGNITPGLEQEWKTIDEHYNFHTDGILAKELQGRFWIAHGDEKPTFPSQGTIPGFIPVQLFLRMNVNFITWVFAGIISLWKLTPMGRTMALAEKSLNRVNEGIEKAHKFADAAQEAKQKFDGLASQGLGGLASQGLKGLESKGLGGLGGLAKGLESKGLGGLAKGLGDVKGLDLAKGLESKGLDLAKGLGDVKGLDLAKGLESKGLGDVKGLASKIPGGLGGLGSFKKLQRGGSLEELSTESQVMGGIIVALLAGGSLKGLIDYTMNQ